MTAKRATKSTRGNRAKAKTKPKSSRPSVDGRDAVEIAALALVKGAPPDQVEASLAARGIATKAAAAAVREAQERITLAADVRIAHELGLAIGQLRDIYALAIKTADAGAALAARKELSKLLRLYSIDPRDVADATAQDSAVAQELADIAAHLRPLNLGPEDYPITEIARIAADMIRRAG